MTDAPGSHWPMGHLIRDTGVACAIMAMVAFAWRPDQPRVGGGVLGGGLLVGVAWWAIRGVVDRVTTRDERGEFRPVSGGFSLVKFFTRHVILALVAYGMMLRLHLDPVGMLIGVSGVTVAAAAELARTRRFGRRS